MVHFQDFPEGACLCHDEKMHGRGNRPLNPMMEHGTAPTLMFRKTSTQFGSVRIWYTSAGLPSIFARRRRPIAGPEFGPAPSVTSILWSFSFQASVAGMSPVVIVGAIALFRAAVLRAASKASHSYRFPHM